MGALCFKRKPRRNACISIVQDTWNGDKKLFSLSKNIHESPHQSLMPQLQYGYIEVQANEKH